MHLATALGTLGMQETEVKHTFRFLGIYLNATTSLESLFLILKVLAATATFRNND